MAAPILRLAQLTILVVACRPSSPDVDTLQPVARDSSQVFFEDSISAGPVGRELVVDQPPYLLAVVLPRYPEGLRQVGVEGRVVLRCIIGRQGKAELSSIEVISWDNREFIEPAKEALRRARFRPGRVRGVPVRTWVNIPMDFKLRGKGR